MLIVVAGTACAAVTGLSDYEVIPDGDAGAAGEGGVSSSGVDGSGSTDPPKTYVEAACAHAKKCLPAGYAKLYGDDATCESTLGIEAARLPADQTARCMSALATADCALDARDIRDCNFKGTVKDGAACRFNSDCASGRCTHDQNGCTICGAQGDQGATCEANYDCQSSLYCDLDKSKCRPRIALNDVCTLSGPDGAVNNPCAPGLICSNGKCVAGNGVGADCGNGKACNATLTCDQNKCREYDYANPGERCGNTGGSVYVVCLNGRCLPNDSKCHAYASVGEACAAPNATMATSPSCSPNDDTVCKNGKCADRKSACSGSSGQ